jgi:hypothetical protein
MENLFKEISNRSLAVKHAMWSDDLWTADDLNTGNYFVSMDATVAIETERHAMRTRSTAFKEKRDRAAGNGSSAIAELTFSAAKTRKTQDDFYAKISTGAAPPASAALTSSSAGLLFPTQSPAPAPSSGYTQPFFPGVYPHTQDPPNSLTSTGSQGGAGAVQQAGGNIQSGSARARNRRTKYK